mmetsp:Transcript_71475/g.125760  ORF Transcript_71475/g.125760 Transcript_71475/m.125760 type:complete len:163 (-) Transcript_71475:125-613(-)
MLARNGENYKVVGSKVKALAKQKKMEDEAKRTAQQITGKGAAAMAVLAEAGAVRNKKGVEVTVLKPGSGKTARKGDKVSVSYKGTLQSTGKKFDQGKFNFEIGNDDVIKGWHLGIEGMREGEKCRLVIPPALGYGKRGAYPDIPPNSHLVFVVLLNKVNAGA